MDPNRGVGRDIPIGSAADAAAAKPVREHRHHRTGRAHGRSATKVEGETKASIKAHATIGKHQRSTLIPDKLEGKIKQEFESVNDSLKTTYARVRAVKHSDGRISFELRLDRPFVRDRATRFGGVPADVTRMVGQFLDPRSKQVAAAGAVEMERVLGAPPPQDASLREFRKQAKHNARFIKSSWDDSISRQVLTAFPPNTQSTWVVLSADGQIRSMTDAWDAQPDLAEGEVLIKLQKNLRFKDFSPEDKEATELLVKHRPYDTKIMDSIAEQQANDSTPAWSVENFDRIADPGLKGKVGLMLDFLNLSMANKQLE